MGSKASKTDAEPEQPKEKFLYDTAVADAFPLDELSNEQIVAISRQLKHHEIHAPPGSPSPADYAQTLVARSTPKGSYKVPTVRFGKTELQMPILTCGGMRVQQSWMPDHFTPGPVGPSALGMSIGYHKMDQIDPAVQANLIKIIRRAISHGIVHFETARFYGTSEMQYADALATLIESGEVKREELIIQTKVFPCATNEEFLKTFEASWKHLKRLKYIDLLGFHGVSNTPSREKLLLNCEVTDQLVAEGRVRHVGFSTHGSAREIRLLIETGKMSYVNLHSHYFGDYHAAGTSASADAELGGNLDNLRLARETYDMGCFLISPYDKGGMLYAPSKKIVALVGHQLSPICFAAIYAWALNPHPFHTISLGAARPEDFDESVSAAKAFEDPVMLEHARAARARLDGALVAAHGEDWARDWWKGLPDMFEAASGGVAIGHILWLHNCVSVYGLYDFARQRYGGLEATRKSWDASKSYEANMEKAYKGFAWAVNPGLSFDPKLGLPEGALAKVPEARRAVILAKLAETHAWLTKDRPEPDDAERVKMGWEVAYDLRAWEEFPGKGFGDMGGLIKQQFAGGVPGGPCDKHHTEAQTLRNALSSSQSPKAVMPGGKSFFASPVTPE